MSNLGCGLGLREELRPADFTVSKNKPGAEDQNQ